MHIPENVLTREDVDAIRSAAEALLVEGTRRLGSEEHKAEFLEGEDRPRLIDIIDTKPVGGVEVIRERAKRSLVVADKIERRLSL